MAKSNYTTTIIIDTNNSVIRFCSMVGNDASTLTEAVKSYRGACLDEGFFERFKEALREFTESTPSESIRKISVILPDSAVLMDSIKIPTMKGNAQTQKMLDVTLGGLYRNYRDLHIVAQMADKNKQYSTVSISAVQNRIVSEIYAAASENKLLVDTLSFESAAAVAGAAMINPKLKNATYLFLDIKDIYSRFAFVVGGKVLGCYTLPFGLEFLRSPRVVGEDMLFDHSLAELTVLNARERAKSKKLTVMAPVKEIASDKAGEDFDAGLSDSDDALTEAEWAESERVALKTTAEPTKTVKLFNKKSPRSLPKFMQRENPETPEGVAYENFRVFVKWALCLIEENEKITSLGKPQFVSVNLPSDLSYLVDMENESAEENGISFTLLSSGEENEKMQASLEIYGGLHYGNINPLNKL